MKKSVRYRKIEAAMNLIAGSASDVEKARVVLERLFQGDDEARKSVEGMLNASFDTLNGVWKILRRMQEPLFPQSVPMQVLWDGPKDNPPAA